MQPELLLSALSSPQEVCVPGNSLRSVVDHLGDTNSALALAHFTPVLASETAARIHTFRLSISSRATVHWMMVSEGSFFL